MQIQNISFKNNANFKANKINKNSEQQNEKQLAESFSKEASDSLKSYILAQQSKKPVLIEQSKNKKDIIQMLEDTNKTGRSFIGYEESIATMLAKSKNPDLAFNNFNILLSANNGNLKASEIYDVFTVSETVNSLRECLNKHDKNRFLKTSLAIMIKEYNFEGGVLDEEKINFIIQKLQEESKMNQLANKIADRMACVAPVIYY